CVLYAGVNGYLDNHPVSKVGPFEQGLLTALRADHADLLSDIASKQALDDDLTGRLKAAIDGFAKGFE
ncbi:MAG: F0F1 ATP synthase subunit alpha, partial [Pseudomonadota bacterium]